MWIMLGSMDIEMKSIPILKSQPNGKSQQVNSPKSFGWHRNRTQSSLREKKKVGGEYFGSHMLKSPQASFRQSCFRAKYSGFISRTSTMLHVVWSFTERGISNSSSYILSRQQSVVVQSESWFDIRPHHTLAMRAFAGWSKHSVPHFHHL